MLISRSIPLDVEAVAEEIMRRQRAPWNNGRINDEYDFPLLQEMFLYMNSGIPMEDYFYIGDLFRIHSRYITIVSEVDSEKERVISKSSDGSCSVLPITEYSNNLVAFSKDHDFTRNCFYKVNPTETAIMIHAYTMDLFGLDINAFLNQYGFRNELYEEEKEVLFPLMSKYVIKEYTCTPRQFNYYLRNA